jgi:hypothetical protein
MPKPRTGEAATANLLGCCREAYLDAERVTAAAASGADAAEIERLRAEGFESLSMVCAAAVQYLEFFRPSNDRPGPRNRMRDKLN